MSSKDSGSGGKGGGGKGEFPINIIARDVGLDASITKLTRFSDALKNAGMNIQNSMRLVNGFGQGIQGFSGGMQQTQQAFSTGSQSANQFNQAINNTINSVRNGQTTLTQYMNTQRQTAQTAQQASASTNQFDASQKRLNQTLNQTSTSGQKASQGFKMYDTGAKQASASSNQFDASAKRMNQTFNQTGASANQAKAGFSNFDTGAKQANASATQFNSTLFKMGSGFGTFNKTAGTAGEGFRMFDSSAQKANQTFQQTTVTLGQGTREFKNIGEAAEESSTKFGGVGDAIGGIISKGTGLFLSFKMMEMSLQEAVGMQEMAAAGEAKIADLREKLVDVTRRFGEESRQASQVQKQLDDAIKGQAYTTRNANMAMGDFSFFTVMVASNIISTLVPAFTKWGETQDKLKKALEFMKGAIDGLKVKIAAKTAATVADTAAEAANTTVTNASFGAKLRETAANVAASIAHRASAVSAGMHTLSLATLTGMTTAVTGAFMRFFAVIAGGAIGAATAMVNLLTAAMARLRLAIMANLAALGPILIAIVAVSAALAIIATDTFGARTAMEDFGYAVSEQVPILYPFLEGLQGVGAALGLTGESAEEANQHFKNATDGFSKMGELWDNTIGSMQDSSNRFVKAIGDTAAVLTTDFKNAQSDFQNQIKATQDTWGEFVDALGKGDFEKAVDIIIKSVEAIPGIIVNIFTHLGTQIWDTIAGQLAILSGLAAEIGPYFEKAWDAIVGLATEIGTRIYDELIKGIAPILDWVKNSIVIPLQNFFNGIWNGLTNIAEQILSALGIKNLPLSALGIVTGMKDNIMNLKNLITDISSEVWDKLKLGELTKKATELAQQIWENISGFFKTVAGDTGDAPTENLVSKQDTLSQGNKDKLNAQKGKSINDDFKYKAQLKNNEFTAQNWKDSGGKFQEDPRYQGYGFTPGFSIGGTKAPQPQPVKPTTTTQTKPTIPTTTPPTSVQATDSNNFKALQDAMSPIQTAHAKSPSIKTTPPPTPTPTTPEKPPESNEFGYLFSKEVPKMGSSSGVGTHEFINNYQKMSEVMKPVATQAEIQKQKLDELEESFKDTSGKVDEAAASGIEFLRAQQNIDPALLNNQANLGAVAQAVGEVKKGNDAMSSSLAANNLALEHNYLQQELSRKGMLEQKKALQEMGMQIETNRGSLQEYGRQVEEGTILSYAFTLGQQEQRKALLDSQVEVANTNGMLQEYALQIEEGTIQQVAFTQGQQEVRKGFMDTVVETSNLKGQFDILGQAMYSANIANVEYNNGLAAGRVEAAQQIIQLDNIKGQYEGNREVLLNYAKAIGITIDVTKLSNDELQELIATFSGSPAAIEKMVGSLNQLGESLRSGLHEAFDKGKKEFDELVESFGKELGIKIAPEVEMIFERAAIREEFQSDFEEILKGISVIIAEPDIKMRTEGLRKFIAPILDNLKAGIKEGEGPVVDQMWTLYKKLEDIMKKPLSTTEIIKSLSELRAEFVSLGDINAAEAIDKFIETLPKGNSAINEFGVSTGNLTQSFSSIATEGQLAAGVTTGLGVGIGAIGNSAQEADPQVQKFYETVQQFGSMESVMQVIWEQNFPQHVLTGTAAALKHVNQFHLNVNGVYGMMNSDAATMFGQIGDQSFAVAVKVTANYNRAKGNADGVLGAMKTSAASGFNAQGDASFAVATKITTNYNRAKGNADGVLGAMRTAANTAFNAIGNSSQVVATKGTAAFNSLRNGANSAFNTIKSQGTAAFNAIASAAQSAGSKGSSAMNSIRSSAQSAKSQVDSLRSSVNSLPNVERSITYRIRTVGSAPAGARRAQFGMNEIVDKPTHILAGEGWGKERVKVQPGTMSFIEDFRKDMANKFGQFLNDKSANNKSSNQNISINKQSNTGKGGNISQKQSNSQKSSNGQNNYNYQSDTNTESNVSGSSSSSSSIPMPPGITIEQGSEGNQRIVIPDSKSRLMRQGDPTGFETRVIHETPVEVNIMIPGHRLAKALVKLLTEEVGIGNGYYG